MEIKLAIEINLATEIKPALKTRLDVLEVELAVKIEPTAETKLE